MVQETVQTARLTHRAKALERLRKLGFIETESGALLTDVRRYGSLIGKLMHEVGSGNVLYGIQRPDSDVATHAAIAAAHHAKYTDTEAISAVEGEATLGLTGVVTINSRNILRYAYLV